MLGASVVWIEMNYPLGLWYKLLHNWKRRAIRSEVRGPQQTERLLLLWHVLTNGFMSDILLAGGGGHHLENVMDWDATTCLIPLFIPNEVTVSPSGVTRRETGGAQTTRVCLNLLLISLTCESRKEKVCLVQIDRSIQNVLILQYFITPHCQWIKKNIRKRRHPSLIYFFCILAYVRHLICFYQICSVINWTSRVKMIFLQEMSLFYSKTAIWQSPLELFSFTFSTFSFKLFP